VFRLWRVYVIWAPTSTWKAKPRFKQHARTKWASKWGGQQCLYRSLFSELVPSPHSYAHCGSREEARDTHVLTNFTLVIFPGNCLFKRFIMFWLAYFVAMFWFVRLALIGNDMLCLDSL
jgi:hypothetical protein